MGKFVSIQKADVKLDETEDEKKRFSKLEDMYKPVTDWWKDKLTELTEKGAMKDAGVKIEKVEVSKRLTESPVVVVTSQFGYSAQQEKVMKAQAFQSKDQIGMMAGRQTLPWFSSRRPSSSRVTMSQTRPRWSTVCTD